MSNKELLLGVLDEPRLRSLAETWGYPIQDRRLRAPGIANELARKRKLTVGTILGAMNDAELAEVCRRVGLATGGVTAIRRALDEGLARAEWKALRREAAATYPRRLVPLHAELLDVIDGDTLRGRLEGHETFVCIRGAGDLDRTEMDRADMVTLDVQATKRVCGFVRRR